MCLLGAGGCYKVQCKLMHSQMYTTRGSGGILLPGENLAESVK